MTVTGFLMDVAGEVAKAEEELRLLRRRR